MCFPVLLTIVVSVKAISEWCAPSSTWAALVFNTTVFAAAAVSTVLYLITLNRKPKNENER